MYYSINDAYQKGIDFTVKMFDLLFLYICRKVEDKKPQASGTSQLDLIMLFFP